MQDPANKEQKVRIRAGSRLVKGDRNHQKSWQWTAKFPQKTPELIGAVKQKIFDAAINIMWRPTESVAQAGCDDSLGLSRFNT